MKSTDFRVSRATQNPRFKDSVEEVAYMQAHPLSQEEMLMQEKRRQKQLKKLKMNV